MTDHAAIEIGELTGVLREVAEEAGLTAALCLARVFGGTKVYVPHRVAPDHPLAEAAGAAAAGYLSKSYGGEFVLIPLGSDVQDAARRRAIRERLAAGRSHQAIARELKCHIRTVEREAQRRRDGGDPDQLSLLD